jgi:hypothetical protein
MEALYEAVVEHFVFVVIVVGILSLSIIKAVGHWILNSQRERSRREIAAYIAEGSISPEQGERLLRANINHPPHSA